MVYFGREKPFYYLKKKHFKKLDFKLLFSKFQPFAFQFCCFKFVSNLVGTLKTYSFKTTILKYLDSVTKTSWRNTYIILLFHLEIKMFTIIYYLVDHISLKKYVSKFKHSIPHFVVVNWKSLFFFLGNLILTRVTSKKQHIEPNKLIGFQRLFVIQQLFFPSRILVEYL